MLKDYVEGHVNFHLHLVVRRIGCVPSDYCAIVRIPDDCELSVVNGDVSDKSQISRSGHPSTQMEFAVLVDVAEFMKQSMNRFTSCLPYVKRLQSLDQFPCLFGESADLVKAASSGRLPVLLPLEEDILVIEDRKLCSAQWSTGLQDRELVDKVVESGAKVVQNFPDDRRPVGRCSTDGVIDEQLLSGLKITLTPELIRFTVDEPDNLFLKLFELRFGSLNLGIGAFK
jgi:hypothetical protein